MRESMRPGLFEEWLAFAALEPYGEPASDEHAAYTLAVLVNAITGGRIVSGKGADAKRKPFTTADFLLEHGKPRTAKKRSERMSVTATVEHVNSLMAMMGGQVPNDLKRVDSGSDLKRLPVGGSRG